MMVPLSYQQEMYLAAERQRTIGYRLVADNRHAANAFAAFRVLGALDLHVLHRAVSEVLRRHESLRSSLTVMNGRMGQLVTGATRAPLDVVDVPSHPSPAERDRCAGEQAARAALGPFDYAGGVMLRAHVIRVLDAESIVVLVVPHIVSDSVSMHVIVDETITLYAHFLRGQGSPLPEPAAQYGEYVRWQREWVQGDILSAARDYVGRSLIGARPLTLPIDHAPAADAVTADASEHRFVLDDERLAVVRAWSQRQRVTPFAVMVSAFTALLAQWSGQGDILLLAPFAARSGPSAQKIVGLCSNLFPLRVHVRDDMPFADLLEQVQRDLLQAMELRSVPHAVLANILGARGDISCTGVGVNAVPEGGKVMPRGCRELLADTEISPYVVDTSCIAVRQMRGFLSFWIGFAASGAISGRLIARRDWFEPATSARAARAFIAALDRLAGAPGSRVGDAFAESRSLAPTSAGV